MSYGSAIVGARMSFDWWYQSEAMCTFTINSDATILSFCVTIDREGNDFRKDLHLLYTSLKENVQGETQCVDLEIIFNWFETVKFVFDIYSFRRHCIYNNSIIVHTSARSILDKFLVTDPIPIIPPC